jgi:hypothetical protein
MAYNFNGTNQHLNINSAPVTAWPLTMACWFNTSNATNNQVLMHLGDLSSTARFLLGAAGGLAGDPVNFAVANDTNVFNSAETTTGYSINTWTHACGVQSSNTSRKAYINGGSSAENTGSTGTQSGIDSVTIALQRFNNVTTANRFTGQIAECGIWSAALTDAEIASLAKGMTCDKVRPQSLVFYAPLVRDLIDYKGGLTITNNNTATVANHPRVYA